MISIDKKEIIEGTEPVLAKCILYLGDQQKTKIKCSLSMKHILH